MEALDTPQNSDYQLAMSSTRAEQIAEELADRIISGALEPGTRLRQDHIAQEFGTSHVPVREAFRRLEAQGLAVNLPRRGVRVKSFSFEEVQEVAEMRAALEGLALRQAGPHLTKAILDEAEKASHAADTSRDVKSWEAANRRFHRLIVEPCNMPRLLAAIDDLQATSAHFLFAAWRSTWEARTDFEHQAILKALRAGDIELGAQLLEKHVRWVGKKPVGTSSGKERQAFTITG